MIDVYVCVSVCSFSLNLFLCKQVGALSKLVHLAYAVCT